MKTKLNLCFVIFGLLCHVLTVEARSTMRFNHSVEDIKSTCNKAIQTLDKNLKNIEESKKDANFANTALALDTALSDFQDETVAVVFLGSVSTKEDIRDAARACETEADQFVVEVFTREPLYKALSTFAQSEKYNSLNKVDRRLVDKMTLEFKRNGMALSKSKRKKVLALQKELIELQNDFSKTIAEYEDFLEVTKDELKGLPESYIEKLESTSDGHYKVTLSYPHYFPFMDDAIDAKARKKLYEKYSQRAGPENVKRLEKAIVIRAKIAKLLGYKNHASYVLEERMAKTPEKVKTFLDELKARLEPLRVAELKTMSEYKKKDSPSDPTIYEWDWRFYNNQILKKEFQVNPDLVRAYFPLEHVTKEMFEIYQTLLGVEFREVKKPMVWHKDVKMYEVRNRGSKKPRAYFYMDLFPRDGKYTHAGAFPLRQGRYDFKEESYIEPIAAIVANFSAPAKNRPSLLSHDELATYFHEFGHIMHQVLTESKYGWFSGTNTERDFVEAPSQMLENWIWNPQMLKKISSHFETRKPLPDEVIMKLIEARNLNVALKNCRQLMFGLFDLTIHTTVKKVNTTSLWQKIKKEVMGIPSGTGSIRQAAFGHIMGGYDAAYYGYLWSEVFAADMFAQFESQGLLNGKIGQKYRETILAPGGSQDAEVMLSTFLGREPSTASFFKQLGLTVSNKN